MFFFDITCNGQEAHYFQLGGFFVIREEGAFQYEGMAKYVMVYPKIGGGWAATVSECLDDCEDIEVPENVAHLGRSEEDLAKVSDWVRWLCLISILPR